ncbi:MAG: hypothetical protein HZA53_09910 [Planctomycetes bacterium]|nr:hypothetical protein [Planctomycetota bacterium]
MKLIATFLLGAAAIGGTILLLESRVSGVPVEAAPRPSAIEGEVRALLAAVPFALEEPWTHAWRAERPEFRGGWLVVLEVDPKLVEPTELAQPVLCAAGETVERLNHGHASGRVVGIVPSVLGPDGLPELELARATFYFGAPALPEAVGARWIEREFTAATQRGRAPFGADAIAAARGQGGAPIVVRDRVELDRLAAQWILEHAPEEKARADQMLVPVTR